MVICEYDSRRNKYRYFENIESVCTFYHKKKETIEKCINEGTQLYYKTFEVLDNSSIILVRNKKNDR